MTPDFAAGQILAEALNSRLGKLYDLVLSGKALETAFESNPLPERPRDMPWPPSPATRTARP